jgi:hypothetical protein
VSERSAVSFHARVNKPSESLIKRGAELAPHVAVVMLSGYCGGPCRRLALADAYIEKGNPAWLMIMRAVLWQRRYGLSAR